MMLSKNMNVIVTHSSKRVLLLLISNVYFCKWSYNIIYSVASFLLNYLRYNTIGDEDYSHNGTESKNTSGPCQTWGRLRTTSW